MFFPGCWVSETPRMLPLDVAARQRAEEVQEAGDVNWEIRDLNYLGDLFDLFELSKNHSSYYTNEFPDI